MPLLQPKRTKYRKQMRRRGNFRRSSSKGTELKNGNFGLRVLDSKLVTANAIEAVRLVLSRSLTQQSKGRKKLFHIKLFPDFPYTKKPLCSGMGSGKADVVGYRAVVKRGRIVVELNIEDKDLAKKILRSASYKLGMKSKFVTKGAPDTNW